MTRSARNRRAVDAFRNRLTSASAPTAVALAYDPAGRLQSSAAGAATTDFLFAGDALVGEYDGAGNILRRHVPGPGTDEPLLWYEGPGTARPQWLHADPQGSIGQPRPMYWRRRRRAGQR